MKLQLLHLLTIAGVNGALYPQLIKDFCEQEDIDSEDNAAIGEVAEQIKKIVDNGEMLVKNVMVQLQGEESPKVVPCLFHPDKVSVYHKTAQSAGADVQAVETVTIKPGERAMVKSNLRLDGIPHLSQSFMFHESHVFLGAARSSFFKPEEGRKLILTNGVGLIDSDYPDDVIFSYYNMGDQEVTIEAGEDIGQVAILATEPSIFPRKNVERTGGFGSTDGQK